MTDSELPGDQQFGPPDVFNLGFTIPGPPEISKPLTESSAYLADLQDKIGQRIDGRLEEAGRTYASLASIPTNRIDYVIGTAAGVLNEHQNRIDQSITNRLGMAGEFAATANGEIARHSGELPSSSYNSATQGTVSPIAPAMPGTSIGQAFTGGGIQGGGQYQPPVNATANQPPDQFQPSPLPLPGGVAMSPTQLAQYLSGLALGQPVLLPNGQIVIGTNPDVLYEPPTVPVGTVGIPSINVPPGIPVNPPANLGDSQQWPPGITPNVPVVTIPPPQSFAPVPGLGQNIAQNDPNLQSSYGRINYPACPILYTMLDESTMIVGQTDKIIDPTIVVSGCYAKAPLGCKINRDPLGNVFSVGCATANNGTPLPPPPPPPPPVNATPNCPICCCCHQESTPCPTGSVRLDGTCVPDPRIERDKPQWGVYFNQQQGSCSVHQIIGQPDLSFGQLIAVGTTVADAQAKSTSVCKPAIIPGDAASQPQQSRILSALCDINAYATPSTTGGEFISDLSKMLWYTIGADNTGRIANVSASLNRDTFGIAGMFGDTINRIVKGLPLAAGNSFKIILDSVGINAEIIGGSTSALILAGIADKYIGGPWEYVTVPLKYHLQKNLPLLFPSASQAMAAYYGNAIDESTMRTWVEQNGYCWEPQKRILQVGRSKPTPLELIQLVRRGLISEAQFDSGMRELGYLESQVRNNFRQLGFQPPPQSDIVRMMVRDADDNGLAEYFQMDTGFTDKYQDQLKEWARWQGISDKAMQYTWRAHWTIPSPTQLFEMYHRNSRLRADNPAYTSYEMVVKALEQQDILPFWIPKLLATSYRRMRLVDVKRAYQIGAIDRDRVKEFYRELGYNEENATVLTTFAEKEKIKAGHSHKSTRQYIAGVIDEGTLRKDLSDDGFRDPILSGIVERAYSQFKRRVNKACVSHLKRRLMHAELTAEQVTDRLIKTGLDRRQVEAMVDAWKCESESAGKEYTAAQIMHYLTTGLIDPLEAMKRLKRIGYTEQDAARIITDGLNMVNAKQAKQAEQQALGQRKALEKAAADAEKTQAQIEKQQATAEKASKAAASAKLKREKALITAAAKLAAACSTSLADWYAYLQAELGRIRQTYKLPIDEAIQVIVTTAEQKECPDLGTFTTELDKLAEAFLSADLADSQSV